MRIMQTQLIVLCLLLCPLLSSAVVYKRVDANGHVTYTDKPLSAEETKQQQKGAPKSETKSLISGDNATDLQKAASSVVGLAASVEAGAKFCQSQVLPEVASKVAGARDVWFNKHGYLVEKAKLIMKGHLSAIEYNSLLRGIDSVAVKMIAKLSAASSFEKQKVCEQMPARYAAPEMDLSANQPLVSTIENYRFKP